MILNSTVSHNETVANDSSELLKYSRQIRNTYMEYFINWKFLQYTNYNINMTFSLKIIQLDIDRTNNNKNNLWMESLAK